MTAALRRTRDVVAVAVDVPRRALGTAPADPGPDPYRSEQWALDALDAEAVWAGGTASGQVVAVVDTGVDPEHPDLSGRVLPGATFLGGPRSGSGWIGAPECAFPSPATGAALDRYSSCGHGTHVAGIVAAVSGNGVGVAGLAQQARILPVRVLDADGLGWDSDVARGIVYAVDAGATVINLSLGGPASSAVLQAAVEYAVAAGVSVVAAAGNSALEGNPVMYPAALPRVLAVAAVDEDLDRAPFSGFGSWVDLAAPGVDILSTMPDYGLMSMSGTSMAAPYAAATVALVRAAAADLTGAEAEARVTATAEDLGAPGRDRYFGAGLISPREARTGTVSGDLLELNAPSAPPLVGAAYPLTGQLTPAGGVPADGLEVTVERSILGARWTELGSATAGADGSFHLDVVATAGARYRARHTAASGDVTVSTAVSVTVRPALSVRLSRSRSGRVTATVGTGLKGVAAPVSLQLRSGGTWRTLASRATGKGGTVALAGGPVPRGASLRVVVAAVPGVSVAATSDSLVTRWSSR